MRGRPRSGTRHITQTGHHEPPAPPPPVTNPEIGECPPDIVGLGREFWTLYVQERTDLQVLHGLDRIALVLAARTVELAGNGDPDSMESARRWLTELCATPATRLKLSSAIKNKRPAAETPTSLRDRLSVLQGRKTAG